MSYIVLGGRPLFGGVSVFGLYVANDAITTRKICDTLFLYYLPMFILRV
jgi:hypothetical protein